LLLSAPPNHLATRDLVRCVVNNESLLHTMQIILIINLVMANTHPKSQLTKRLVVGLSGKKNGKSDKNTWREEVEGFAHWCWHCYMFTT
jgi:hypothetical protein